MTTKSLFDVVCDPSTLFMSFYRARKGIQDKTEANLIELNLEKEIYALSRSIADGSYEFGPYRTILVRDPKARLIHVAPFRDRIVHHAINYVVSPLAERRFIGDSFACRKGKGNGRALARLQRWIDGDPNAYVLMIDVKKFFYSVDRSVLLAQLKKLLPDKNLLLLIEKLVLSAPSPLFAGKGLPIGNLTSQTFANLYLDEFDHFAKDQLGIRRYLRYVDDIVCLGSKDEMHKSRKLLGAFLSDRLSLAIAPGKDKVLAARNGIPFLGFVLKPNSRPRLKKEAIKRFFHKIRLMRARGLCEPDIAARIASWYAYAKLADVSFLLRVADAARYTDGLK